MTSRDIFQALSEQDDATIDRVVERLELRGRDPRFVAMRGAYLEAMDLGSAFSFLDLGCGSGIDARAAAKRPEFRGTATGVDLSEGMIVAGRRLAEEEGVGERVDLSVGNAEAVDAPDASFDAIVAHTLVSHVKDPLAVLNEASRLLTSRGRFVIFDADFASLSFGYPDPAVARSMEDAMLAALVANPRVMRDLPRLLHGAGLKTIEVKSSIVADVGASAFFGNFIETYTPFVVRQGLIDAAIVEEWLAEERSALAEERFFGSLNFHAYITRKA
jgi:SAM-dependent methyltransferase